MPGLTLLALPALLLLFAFPFLMGERMLGDHFCFEAALEINISKLASP